MPVQDLLSKLSKKVRARATRPGRIKDEPDMVELADILELLSKVGADEPDALIDKHEGRTCVSLEYAVYYQNLVFIATAAIRESTKEYNKLKKDNAILQERLRRLENPNADKLYD